MSKNKSKNKLRVKSRRLKKNGAVYTLDATLAILLTFLAVMAVNSYFSRVAYNKLLIGQPSHLASDVVRMLEKTDVLNDYYLENEFLFSGIVLDSQGNNSGFLRNYAKFETSYNDFNNYWISFDEKESYVFIPYSEDWDCINNSEEFTISVKLKVGEIGKNYSILEQFENHSNNWLFYINDNGKIVFYSNNSLIYTSDNVIIPNNWINIAITSNKTNLTFFMNGEKLDSFSSINITNSNANISMGYSEMFDSYFKGYMGDIKIFDVELNESDIFLLHKDNVISKVPLIDYNLNVKTETINIALGKYFQPQYSMVVRLIDYSGRTIANSPLPSASSVLNYMASGSRITAIKDNGNITNIVKVEYYAWTR
jgi:hypothetical protein